MGMLRAKGSLVDRHRALQQGLGLVMFALQNTWFNISFTASYVYCSTRFTQVYITRAVLQKN